MRGEAARIAVAGVLNERFEVYHTTIQTERVPCEDAVPLHR